MASETSICNRALQRLGAEGRIASLDENSSEARACNLAYEPCRDALLREHPWGFARRRVQLAALSTAPAFEFAAQYQLPADFVRLVPEGDAVNWQIEGDRLLANDTGPLNVIYIAKVTDVAKFDDLFVEALSARLAVELCEKITQSNTKLDMVTRAYEALAARARRVNGLEGRAVVSTDDTWLSGRI